MKTIDIALLKSALEYDPDTGIFRWKIARHNHIDVGGIAGKLDNDGYIIIGYARTKWKASRLAWAIMTGGWPAAQIDHCNLDRSNNRWSNLRQATKSQNGANTRVKPSSKTGLKGVQFRGPKKYAARITRDGHRHFLGYFSTPESASAAYQMAATKLFSEFARPA